MDSSALAAAGICTSAPPLQRSRGDLCAKGAGALLLQGRRSAARSAEVGRDAAAAACAARRRRCVERWACTALSIPFPTRGSSSWPASSGRAPGPGLPNCPHGLPNCPHGLPNCPHGLPNCPHGLPPAWVASLSRGLAERYARAAVCVSCGRASSGVAPHPRGTDARVLFHHTGRRSGKKHCARHVAALHAWRLAPCVCAGRARGERTSLQRTQNATKAVPVGCWALGSVQMQRFEFKLVECFGVLS